MSITLDGSNANTVGVINSATAKNATGTAVDFTGIPAGTKRITVTFNNVSLSGTADYLVQVGSGSITTTGYYSLGNGYNNANATAGSSSTSGFVMYCANAGGSTNGHMVLTPVSGNTWVSSHSGTKGTATITVINGGGNVALTGTLDRVRVTTTNGTDTFDAGSINILYE